VKQPIPNIRKSIQEISEIEKESLQARSVGERIGDLVVNRSGRMWFIVFHIIWFLLWIVSTPQADSKRCSSTHFPTLF